MGECLGRYIGTEYLFAYLSLIESDKSKVRLEPGAIGLATLRSHAWAMQSGM